MNKELCKIVIEQLDCWRNCFLDGTDWSFEKSLGITEITDQLENISSNGHDCYASFLFNQLSENDKEYIEKELEFYVNFDELYAVYDL